MAVDNFTGTASTALATHDAAWTANTQNDGLTGAVLDGSGHVNGGSFKFNDFYYNGGGTGANSASHVTIPSGCTIDALGNFFGPAIRMNTTQLGYRAFLKSTTNVNTNVDQIGVRAGLNFLATVTLDAAKNLSTTPIQVTIRLVNTVDIEIVVDGRTYTKSDNALLGGTGGNDGSGNAVLTGGFPGAFIYHNSGSTTQKFDDWTDDAAGVTVTDVDVDEQIYNGQTGVVISGSGFGSTQGSGTVKISPTNNVADAGAVSQTVTAWSDTSITITAVKGSLSFDTNAYLFVTKNGGSSNASGMVVQVTARPFVQETLIDKNGAAVASLTGITMLVWRASAGPSTGTPNPDQALTVATNGSGQINQEVNRGSLAIGDPVWIMLLKNGTPAKATARKVTPVYQ
jgi:hypothetical protein